MFGFFAVRAEGLFLFPVHGYPCGLRHDVLTRHLLQSSATFSVKGCGVTNAAAKPTSTDLNRLQRIDRRSNDDFHSHMQYRKG